MRLLTKLYFRLSNKSTWRNFRIRWTDFNMIQYGAIDIGLIQICWEKEYRNFGVLWLFKLWKSPIMIQLFQRQEPIAFWRFKDFDNRGPVECRFDLSERGATRINRRQKSDLFDPPRYSVRTIWVDACRDESIVCRTDVYPLLWIWYWVAVRLEESIYCLRWIWR
jgi:hypothetical protein